MKQPSRNLKAFRISVEDVLTLMGGWVHRDGITLPMIEGLPEDAELRNATFSPEHQAFLIFVAHPSFPEISPNHAIPIEMTKWVAVDMRAFRSDASEQLASVLR